MQWDIAVYGYIGLLLFEGATNWRVPVVVSKLRYGDQYQDHVDACSSESNIPFDAERMLRVIVALFVIISFVLFSNLLWFFPWFIGFMLMMAGITNICPMVMALRWVGFR